MEPVGCKRAVPATSLRGRRDVGFFYVTHTGVEELAARLDALARQFFALPEVGAACEPLAGRLFHAC